MEDTYEPYITQYSGNVITAEDSNKMQVMIKKDINEKTKAAVDDIERVPNADNADKLEEKTLAEITEEIVQRALSEIPKQTGYRQLFLKLEIGEEKVIEHNLKACPLVDLYQLDYFMVGASEDGYQFEALVNFYLYHSSERRLRFKDESEEKSPLKIVDIEPTEGHAYKIPFKDMLEYYDIEYTDDSSLGDVETEFWKAFFADPNDDFDDDQQAHSPWFDRCCRENMSIKQIKRKRDWDDIWFQMRPRKMILSFFPVYDTPAERVEEAVTGRSVKAATKTVVGQRTIATEVTHFDFNTLGLKLHVHTDSTSSEEKTHLDVMVLLKV